MASYTLTRYFLLYILSRILRADAVQYVAEPELLDDVGIVDFLTQCADVMKTVIVDLNYESKEADFDYKSILKSQNRSVALADRMLATYEKDVERDKAATFKGWGPTVADV